MIQGMEIILQMERREFEALDHVLADCGCDIQLFMQARLEEFYRQLVPSSERNRIEKEITVDCFSAGNCAETECACSAYHVVENGQEWYFTTTPGDALLDASKKLRSYAVNEDGTAPGLFIKMFSDTQPITAGEFFKLTQLYIRNAYKVRGIFDIDFDKRKFSAGHIADGQWSWAMRDVIPSVYQATRPRFATTEEQLRKLLELLDGMEITSAGHLSARNFSFGEEIIESDGKLNFYVQADFDVDAAFGTYVCTDQNDDWLNIYANYDIENGYPCDTLELNLCKADGTEESWNYHLNAAEQEVLARKMEEFCQQQTGMGLREYAQQIQEEQTRTSEMEM